MSTAVQTVPKNNEVEYKPFGSDDAIKLSVSIIQKYIANPTKSGKMPDERDCMRFLMLCRSQRLNPFLGDCHLVGYDGKDGPEFSMITAHQVFLKRAEHALEFDGMESGVIVREGDDGDVKDRVGDFLVPGDVLLGGWAVVHFKTRKHPMIRRLNVATFRKPNKFWNENPQGMIVKCAEADALRSSFPSLLGDLVSAPEAMVIDVQTMAAKVPELEPARTAALPQRASGSPQGAPAGVSTPAKAETQAPAPAASGVQAPSGSQAPAPAATAPPAPEAPPAPAAPAAPQPGVGKESDACGSVRLLMNKSGVTEQQLMEYARAQGMAKANQMKISDLSDAKLLTLSKAWHNILPTLRGTVAK